MDGQTLHFLQGLCAGFALGAAVALGLAKRLVQKRTQPAVGTLMAILMLSGLAGTRVLEQVLSPNVDGLRLAARAGFLLFNLSLVCT